MTVGSSTDLGGDYYPDSWLTRHDHPYRVVGIADLHAHPMAQFAFGGGVLHGAIDGDPAAALTHCGASHRFLRRAVGRLIERTRQHGGGFPDFGAWPTFDGLTHQQMHIEW